MRHLPLKVIPSGKPIEKLSARFVVLPPAWVTSGSTKPKCPPRRVWASSARVWASADGALDIRKTPTATQRTPVYLSWKAALNVFSPLNVAHLRREMAGLEERRQHTSFLARGW